MFVRNKSGEPRQGRNAVKFDTVVCAMCGMLNRRAASESVVAGKHKQYNCCLAVWCVGRGFVLSYCLT